MDFLPPEQARVRDAIARAGAEYQRRNAAPIPVTRTQFQPFWTIQATAGQEVDGYAYDEASALMRAALSIHTGATEGRRWPGVSPGPGRDPFALVPSAAAARRSAAAEPWWKRIFAHADAAPTARPILPTQAFDPYLRQVRDVQRFGGAVHNEPVSTVADLLELERSVPAAMPATGLGLAEMMKERTVSGGGGVNAGLPGLTGFMGGFITDIVHSQGNDLTVEQSLDIAIQQRNALVRDGASKTLIAHWNKEIRDLLWIQRRMPI